MIPYTEIYCNDNFKWLIPMCISSQGFIDEITVYFPKLLQRVL